MNGWRKAFNGYLALGLALVAWCGCEAPKLDKPGKQITLMSFHLEANPRATVGTNRTEQIFIGRNQEAMLTVLRDPFLDTANIRAAKVIDDRGGFALRVEMERQGTWLLESQTVAHRGKRFAIFCKFIGPDGKSVEARWLAAPRVTRRITDGVFTFTPDATRQEAERIARGLTDVGRQLEKNSKLW